MLLLYEKGHFIKNYKIRKVDIPKSLVRWVPEGIVNTVDAKFKGDQFLKPNLFLMVLWHPRGNCGTWIVVVQST